MDTNIEVLLKRVTLFLEDGDWAKANEYCERVLDQDPENAEAYLGKLLAELRVRSRAELSKLSISFAENKNYQKALRYGNEALQTELTAAQDAAKAAQVAKEAAAKAEAESKAKAATEAAEREATLRKAKEKRAALIFAILGAAAVLAVLAFFLVPQAVQRAKRRANGTTISASHYHTVGLKTDGTVVAVGGRGNGKSNVPDWKDIVAIAAGYTHTVGLKADGTVVAVSWAVSLDELGQYNVDRWGDIIVVMDYNNEFGQCNVDCWKDIIAVAAGYYHTVGLKADGTVVAVGLNGDCVCDVSDWKDIVTIAAGYSHTVGLKADGTVVAVGENEHGQCNVERWKDIVAIAAGFNHTVGLKADGTVVAVGWNEYGQCDVSGWKDIIAIAAGGKHTVGLKADGTVVAVGWDEDGQCDVSGWKDIRVPGK